MKVNLVSSEQVLSIGHHISAMDGKASMLQPLCFYKPCEVMMEEGSPMKLSTVSEILSTDLGGC